MWTRKGLFGHKMSKSHLQNEAREARMRGRHDESTPILDTPVQAVPVPGTPVPGTPCLGTPMFANPRTRFVDKIAAHESQPLEIFLSALLNLSASLEL